MSWPPCSSFFVVVVFKTEFHYVARTMVCLKVIEVWLPALNAGDIRHVSLGLAMQFSVRYHFGSCFKVQRRPFLVAPVPMSY